MAEDKKDFLQDSLDGVDDYKIADDGQIEDMQREFAALGIGGGKNTSRLCQYPLPVYTLDSCYAFCKYSKEMVSILKSLDKFFVSRNQNAVDFLLCAICKNSTAIALKGEFTGEIFLPVERMPIKQSMYRLLELHNLMSITLDGLTVYDKSASMGEVVTRHLLLGSVLHGICI